VFICYLGPRHVKYPLYKAHRPDHPPGLTQEVSRILSLVDALGIPVLAVPGAEADDVVGALAVRAVREGLQAVVVSPDKVTGAWDDLGCHQAVCDRYGQLALSWYQQLTDSIIRTRPPADLQAAQCSLVPVQNCVGTDLHECDVYLADSAAAARLRWDFHCWVTAGAAASSGVVSGVTHHSRSTARAK